MLYDIEDIELGLCDLLAVESVLASAFFVKFEIESALTPFLSGSIVDFFSESSVFFFSSLIESAVAYPPEMVKNPNININPMDLRDLSLVVAIILLTFGQYQIYKFLYKTHIICIFSKMQTCNFADCFQIQIYLL